MYLRYPIAAALFFASATALHAKDVVGFWSCQGSGPGLVEGRRVSMSVQMNVEFSPNGGYAERGRMVGGGLDLTASGTGSWVQTGDLLSTKVSDWTVQKMVVNGNEVAPLLANIMAMGTMSEDGETTTYRVEGTGWFSSDITLSNPDLPELTCTQR